MHITDGTRVINAYSKVSTDDPTESYDDGPYPYTRSYTTSSPTYGYTYSFNDSTYYRNYDGGEYIGYHLHVGYTGTYFIKTEYVYNYNEYFFLYTIQDGETDYD